MLLRMQSCMIIAFKKVFCCGYHDKPSLLVTQRGSSPGVKLTVWVWVPQIIEYLCLHHSEITRYMYVFHCICNNMPVMLIRVIRDCNVRSDFYDVNRVLFKDGRVLSRFLIMVAAVQWYLSPHTNPWTPKVGWMQDKLFIYLFDLRLVRDAEIFAPKPSRFHQSRCMGRLETAFRAVQDSH